MNTDDLIASLSADIRPVPRHALGRRTAIGMAAGAIATLLAVIGWLGLRSDLGQAIMGTTFWIKWAYTISLALAATLATVRLARPDGRPGMALRLLAVPVIVLALIALVQLVMVPRSAWLKMWLGDSWMVCSRNVFVLALPIFLGLLWAFRRFAPTRLALAGMSAGLAAGAWAATLYCLHCPETSALFVLTWYSLGMILAGLAGRLLGPVLLRW